MDKSKVCLTTFVYGEAYQNYIPLLIYSIKKAYPEYSIIIFVYGNLIENVKIQLITLKEMGKFEVKENQFSELNISTPLEAAMTRWILPHEYFREFDYLYTVDTDMLYIKEPVDLHIQHIEHMKYLGLPFSNILRTSKPINTKKRRSIINRIKKRGFNSFLKYYRSGEIQLNLMSGLHFVEVEPYFNAITVEQKKLKEKIINKSYKYDFIDEDEGYLYDLISNSDFDLSKIGGQEGNLSMLDFNNPRRANFRPHHGIHLGVFRTDNLVLERESLLQSKEYLYYINALRDYFTDPLFCSLITKAGEDVQSELARLANYYKMKGCK